MKYENKLVNFNGHEWVWFRADQKTGNMCIDFSDGRHYGCLENFEESVEEKYGNNRK